MDQTKIDYNKKMVGQKVKVIDQHGFNWIGEVKETVDDHSFIVKDDSNRDFVVNIHDIRSVDMAQLSRV
jgi:ATP-dependent 26S proteasome regulatory subunit|tara:strand:- start:1723 stop:1929 length:207 start_codon:yes stop_codon:yes gene_type:complete